MSSITQSLRSLGRSPGFTAVVVLSLGLGIGACTSVFSVLNAFLFVPLPYRESERLVELEPTASPSTIRLAGDSFQRERVDRWIANGMESFESIGWESQETLRLMGPDGAESLRARVVSGSWFQMLGVEALRGRVIVPEDAATGEPVAVVTEQLWRGRFGGSSEIVGQTLRISGIQFTVVGVVSERVLGGQGVWVTASSLPAEERPFIVTTVARLAAGVTIAAAQSELSVVTAAEVAADPIGSVGFGAMPRSLTELTRRTDRGGLWLALGMAGAALLMALTNLMTLFLVRAARRSRVAAIRIALGAGLSQLGKGLVADGLILGVAGAVVGLLLGYWGRFGVTKVLGFQYSLDYAPPMDWRVFSFATVLSLTCALLLALEPLRTLRVIDVRSLLQRSAGATSSRADARSRHIVVAVQIAASIVVGVAAVYTTARYDHYFGIDLGYDAERLVVAVPDLQAAGLAPAQRSEVAASVIARLDGRPGVAAAGAWYQSAQRYPPRPEYDAVVEQLEVGQFRRPPAYYYAVSPGFLGFVGATMLQGRDFTEADRAGAPEVAIVSEDAVRRWWPGQDPLGKQIKLGEDGAWATVVGVSSDMAFLNMMGLLWWNMRRMIREGGRDSGSVGPQLFRPLAQLPSPPTGWSEGCSGCEGLEIAVRASGDADAPREALSAALREQFPDLPTRQLGTIRERQAASFGGRQIAMTRLLAGGAAGVTLLLAMFGVLGVVADGVTRRTRELGIRVALGATPRRVVFSAARDSMITGIAGLGVGTASVFLLRAVLVKALDPISAAPGVARMQPSDPSFVLAAATGILLLTVITTLVAARRATLISPAEALRHE